MRLASTSTTAASSLDASMRARSPGWEVHEAPSLAMVRNFLGAESDAINSTRLVTSTSEDHDLGAVRQGTLHRAERPQRPYDQQLAYSLRGDRNGS